MSLIEPALARANMQFMRLDGSMSQKARVTVLDGFRDASKFTILLISLRAGGVGLNLTSAKRVFMMDPWWSFAVEAQAIDRVHRMGQDDEVKVYRLIAKDSVEERMLKVQDRKKFMYVQSSFPHSVKDNSADWYIKCYFSGHDDG